MSFFFSRWFWFEARGARPRKTAIPHQRERGGSRPTDARRRARRSQAPRSPATKRDEVSAGTVSGAERNRLKAVERRAVVRPGLVSILW